jgi:hypothetical protein
MIHITEEENGGRPISKMNQKDFRMIGAVGLAGILTGSGFSSNAEIQKRYANANPMMDVYDIAYSKRDMAKMQSIIHSS